MEFREDSFTIISSLYVTYCGNVKSVSDIYNILKDHPLDAQLMVSLESFDENTIKIINQLDNNIHVIIGAANIDKKAAEMLSKIEHQNCHIYVDFFYKNIESFDEDTIKIINQLNNNVHVKISVSNIDTKTAEMLSKIEHQNCYISVYGYIYQSAVEQFVQLLSKMHLNASDFLIDKITSNTINIINNICNAVTEPSFRIEIKDKTSLQNLYSIVPYITEYETLVEFDDNLFSEKNPNNARSLIISGQGKELVRTEKMDIRFNDISHESVEQIYELEKYLEIIKSHIPSGASDLDIVTYVSMFIVNYFKYDLDLCEKDEDITLPQFVTSGKGVCRHFASFTKYLLNSLGVECERVNAYADVGGHAFNVVKIDGKMYFLDNTWLAGEMQRGIIHSLAESTNYLASNTDFGHEDYKDELEDYECESYNREEINNAVARVLSWNQNYKIHLTALLDLFRKHILKKEMSIDQKIENAIPRRN